MAFGKGVRGGDGRDVAVTIPGHPGSSTPSLAAVGTAALPGLPPVSREVHWASFTETLSRLKAVSVGRMDVNQVITSRNLGPVTIVGLVLGYAAPWVVARPAWLHALTRHDAGRPRSRDVEHPSRRPGVAGLGQLIVRKCMDAYPACLVGISVIACTGPPSSMTTAVR
jgi:hypothetical protein